MTNPAPRLFSASAVLGSRAGSVAVRVSGCTGAAWVWCNRHRTAPASLALRIPATAPDPASSARSTARAASARFGLRVQVRRAPCGAFWLKCSGPRQQQQAAAAWWSWVVTGHARAVADRRAHAAAYAARQQAQQ